MFFMLVLISVFCLFLNDAGFVFLKQRRATYRAVYLWGDRCDLPPAGVLATIDGERLASDELGSLKIKNRVDNLAYLAHATDRDAGRQRIHGFQGRASAF
jgi:hypothetical protein